MHAIVWYYTSNIWNNKNECKVYIKWPLIVYPAKTRQEIWQIVHWTPQTTYRHHNRQSGSDSLKLYVVDVNDWSQSLNKYKTQWSLSPATKMYYSVLFRNVPFCQSDKQILKTKKFIFHLSGCNTLNWMKFFSPPENYSTKSGDNEPPLTPVNTEGLSCWAASNPKFYDLITKKFTSAGLCMKAEFQFKWPRCFR
jgi:hypothetical protein